jgi:hypothetical protein
VSTTPPYVARIYFLNNTTETSSSTTTYVQRREDRPHTAREADGSVKFTGVFICRGSLAAKMSHGHPGGGTRPSSRSSRRGSRRSCRMCGSRRLSVLCGGDVNRRAYIDLSI